MDAPLNFAVIGCGMLAQSTHLPNIARSPRMRLHTCCDVADDALAVCREKFGAQHTTHDYRAAIADPEVQAICIATQEQLRLPLIEAAAAARKPVYCEKPIATSLAEALTIQRVVHAAGIPFCVGHNRRCSPAMRDAHRLFRAHMAAPQPCPWRFDREGAERPRLPDDGVAGMSVRINDDWYSWKAWALDKEKAPHGPMLFEMTHFTDMCNWFLGAEPEEVTALEYGVFNHGVVVRYRTGELATISMSANGTFGYPKELYEIFGHGGAVVVDHMAEVRTAGLAGAPARTTYPILNDHFPQVGTEGGIAGWLAKNRAAGEAAARGEAPYMALLPGVDKGHARALDYFVDEILGRGPQVCGIDDTIRATRVAFAAIKSAHERRVVRLDEL